jgi:small subunit ribosomal protein S6
MKRYEIVLVALSDLSKDEVDGLISRCSSIITNEKGIVIKTEKWGTRKLAYRIKKQPRGSYVLIDFIASPAAVSELERILKFDDEVLRFLTIKKMDAVDLREIEKEIAGVKKDESTQEQRPEVLVIKEAEGSAEKAPLETEGAVSGDAPAVEENVEER